jgi:cytochrome c
MLGALNVLKLWALRDLTMASFNTVAGCVLASALFAMVVGKVSNALVHPHKLEKPAIAVSDEAPTTAVAAAPAQELPPIGPKLAGANVEAGKAIFQKQCFTCHTTDKGGDWTYKDINHLIFKPTAYVKGTKMAFAGLPKEQERADVIAYLRALADSPKPLP